MKLIVPALVLALTGVGASALAQQPAPTMPSATAPSAAPATTCAAQVTEKKLAGAAKTSFSKRCERDANAACGKEAADRKLAGAAKASFTKKCVRDAVGS
jgi:hypothetical protein